jgi:hypothetical protein
MEKRTIAALEHFLDWIKRTKEVDFDMPSKKIVEEFNKNFLVSKLIENLIIEDYKESKEASDNRKKLWNDLVVEATKRDWCKTPQDAIEYANQVVEATL